MDLGSEVKITILCYYGFCMYIFFFLVWAFFGVFWEVTVFIFISFVGNFCCRKKGKRAFTKVDASFRLYQT